MNSDSRIPRQTYWLVTGVFSVMMLFTAYAQWSIPVVAQEISRLGFPAYHFRLELCIAKVLGVLALLLPVPSRLKEWAYAGFAIVLVSAVIAHLAMGDGPDKYLWPVGFGAALAFSYILFCKRAVGTYPA
ncbi:MAG: DoxX family protein [Planctomycetes bacterium]|nr:DoxX family protein [Planctomycetota bacterium]MBI3835718.1 DoxX family protein [Planctomycetota bacterium]